MTTCVVNSGQGSAWIMECLFYGPCVEFGSQSYFWEFFLGETLLREYCPDTRTAVIYYHYSEQNFDLTSNQVVKSFLVDKA